MSQDSENNSTRAGFISGFSWFVAGYDIILLLTLSVIASHLFFPHADSTTSILAVFAVISLSLLGRFFGSLVFAEYGDIKPKNKLMILLISTGGLALIMFATPIIPNSYSSIPIIAIFFLIISRGIIGFLVGGIWSAASMYAMEVRTDGNNEDVKNQGIFSSRLQIGFHVGLTVGHILFSILKGYWDLDTLADGEEIWNFLHYFGAGISVLSFILISIEYRKSTVQNYDNVKHILNPIKFILQRRFLTRPLYSLSLIMIGLMYVYYSTIAVFIKYLQLGIIEFPEIIGDSSKSKKLDDWWEYIGISDDPILYVLIFATLSLLGHLTIGYLHSKREWQIKHMTISKVSEWFDEKAKERKNETSERTNEKILSTKMNSDSAYRSNFDVILILSFVIVSIVCFLILLSVNPLPESEEKKITMTIVMGIMIFFATGSFGLAPMMLFSFFDKRIRKYRIKFGV